jgi:tellurite methyltransferase
MQTIPGVKSSGGYNYPTAPRQQVIDLLKLLKAPSEILDIGAGFGNNCVPLLKQGHRLTATETNKEALKALRVLSEQYPGQLTVIEEPIEVLTSKSSYDAVICTMVLHFLSEEAAHTAIDMMQEVTRPGGYHVIVNYLTKQGLSPEYIWLLKPQELLSFYKTWGIVSYEESYSLKLKAVRSLKQFLRYMSGRRGYKSARLVAMKKN